MSQRSSATFSKRGSEPVGRLRFSLAATAVPPSCSSSCRFFEDYSEKSTWCKDGPTVRFASRQPLYNRGDAARYAYKLLEGAVRISRILMDGHRQVLDFVLPGDTFGLENSDTYSATAEAIGEVVVLRCPKACIAHQLAAREGASQSLAGMLSQEISSAQDHVAMLTHQGATKRVASFVLRFAEKPKDGGRVFGLPVGRQDMADYLGLTIETTCRSLGEMRDAGVITIRGRRQLEIRDRAALEAYAEGTAT